MIISGNYLSGNIGANIKRFEYKNFQVYYKGLIYIPRITEGKESIIRFLDTNSNDFLKTECLRGQFMLIIYNILTKDYHVFGDNNGIEKIFHTEQNISDSLLELIDYNKFNTDDISYKKMFEFLFRGYVYDNQTLIHQIKVLKKEIVIRIQDNKMQFLNKKINPFNSLPNSDIYGFFEDFVKSVGHLNITLDLTAGSDSRMLMALLELNNVNYKVAVAGISNHKDVVISKSIAHTLNKKWLHYEHDFDTVDKKSLVHEFQNIFIQTDGQISVIDSHRKYNYFNMLKSNNSDLHLSGVYGNIFKDHQWVQDFPFYSSKKSRIDKVISYRIAPIRYNEKKLSSRMSDYSKTYISELEKRLNTFKLTINTQTYDNIDCNYKLPVAVSTIAGMAYGCNLNTYEPFSEQEAIRIGYNLKRKMRFFNNFHRQTITKSCNKISSIRTDKGLTCSSNPYYVFTDIFVLFYDLSKRLLKQILRKLIKKTYFSKTPNDSRIYRYFIETKEYQLTIEKLKQYDIINPSLDESILSDTDISRLYTIGLFIEYLEKNK